MVAIFFQPLGSSPIKVQDPNWSITMPADALASNYAKPSAGTVLIDKMAKDTTWLIKWPMTPPSISLMQYISLHFKSDGLVQETLKVQVL